MSVNPTHDRLKKVQDSLSIELRVFCHPEFSSLCGSTQTPRWHCVIGLAPPTTLLIGVKVLVTGPGSYLDFSFHDSQQVNQVLLCQIRQRRPLPVCRFLRFLGRSRPPRPALLLLSLHIPLPLCELWRVLLFLFLETFGGLDGSTIRSLHGAGPGSHFLPGRGDKDGDFIPSFIKYGLVIIHIFFYVRSRICQSNLLPVSLAEMSTFYIYKKHGYVTFFHLKCLICVFLDRLH